MAKMKAKQRNALPKKVFGIPAKRKFPLNDEAHVKAAVRLFGRASDEDKPALARKILSRAKTLGMDSSGWKKVHEWANKSSTVKESALIGFEHYFEESEELLIPDEDITIRKATKDDLDFIVEMELSTFSEKTKSHYPGIPEYCKRDAKKYLDSTEIIMDDDERIGIYMAYMDGDVWFISSIALLPEYQNRGIGSALIQHDIDTHDKIQLYVDIYNDKAKKLYEKLGFRVIEHDDDHWIMELDKKNNVKLVDATKDDIDYIYECELQTTSDDEKKDPDFRKEVRKDAEYSVGHTKIIMLNDTRVGIYQAYATNKWGLKEGEKDWWYIAEIYLSPDARGKGIGTSIIETDISNHDKLLLNVLKENKKAIKLYKRLGFKIDKEFDNRYIMRLEKSTFQESTQHIQIGYRFTYNGEGIYEALKKAMFKKTNSSSAWMQFKNSTACTWLPVPPQYKGDDELNSYFTEEGRDKFKKLTIPYMKRYLDSDKIEEDKVDISSMEVVYSDEYQYVVKVFNLTVSYIKEAIKKIHDKTEKDSKPPTGNQNCQICTWCLEAQCRGIDAVPRAVYSPRDKGLAIYGPSIVIDPYKIRITDRNDVYDTVRKAGEGARFWVHVNWNQSAGGHEFMLINIDSKTYIADAQAGSLIEFGPEPKDVETLRTTKDYFYEINFAHSYIVRLDNKKLNKKILDEATDESKTLPWDEKKDIEYMRREGMLAGEEDEEHAKKTGLITESTSNDTEKVHFIYRRWDIRGKAQYGTIARFYELVESLMPNVKERGYGTDWTADDFLYGIIVDTEPSDDVLNKIRREFPDMEYDSEYEIPTKYEKTVTGKVKDLEEIYDDIWTPGPLENELEEYPSEGEIRISRNYRNSLIDKCISYAMGVDSSIYELKDKGFDIVEDDGDYCVTFDWYKRNIWEKYIEEHIQDTYWNEYIRLSDITIYFMIKEHNRIKRVTNKDFEENKSLLDTCNRLCEGDFKTIKDLIFSNDFYKRELSKVITEATSDMIPDVINEMIPILKSSKYGIGYKGKLITDPTNADYNEKWHCLSPEEFLEYHGGVCYDYVEWEADYLKKHGIKFKKFHISYHVGFDKNDPGEDASTHSICVAIVDGKYIYIEGSSKRLAKKMNYVEEFDDLDKLLDFAVDNMQHDPKQNKLMIIDYTNVKGFIGWNMFGYQGKIFSEGKVIKSDFTQEQFIEESYWDEHHNKLYFHLSPDSYLDGQVFKPRVPEYLDRYDPEDKNFENDTTPRVCLSPSIEGCLNGIMVNMPRVNVMPAKSTRFYVYIPEKPFHEYKHKTNKELIRDKDIFDASVTQEVWILEPVRMKLYGVIEIDSVTNVKRKQNVPTVSGKKSTRPYYKYKWHWLVKPKVLEKCTKFDYSVPRVIELLCMDLPKFRYGLIRDGRLQTGNVSESDYDKYWVVHSPEEIDEAGGGNCWDMVEWEAGYLESYGVKYNKYFLSMEHNKKLSTHTFIVVKDHGKFIYIEQAFKRVVDEIGNSKEFDKLEDIFDYVIEASMEFDNMKECNYGIWDYTDIKFKVGTPAKNFMDYIITNGENVYEGNKSNRKKDDSK